MRYRVTIDAFTRSKFCTEIEADSQDEAEMLAEWIETEGQFEEDIDYWDEHDPVVEEISEGGGDDGHGCGRWGQHTMTD